MVSEQTCTCCDWTDKSLSLTLRTFDRIHSSHMWTPAILLCGEHRTTLQMVIVWRLWFCRRPWRFQANIWRNSVHFWKSNVCTEKSDVQETSVSHSSTEAETIFLSMQVHAWMGFPALDLWDTVIEVCHSVPNQTDGPKRELQGRQQLSSQTCKTPSQSTTPT